VPMITKRNPLPAEIAFYAVQPSQQDQLTDTLVRFIQVVLTQQPGFLSGTVHRSLDQLWVVSYTQWVSPMAYLNSQKKLPKINAPQPPELHFYEIFGEEPYRRAFYPAPGMPGVVTVSAFAMHHPANQPRFMALAEAVLKLIAGYPGLISSHFHRSFDGLSCVNYLHWQSLAAYEIWQQDQTRLKPILEMQQLASYHAAPTHHEIIFTT